MNIKDSELRAQRARLSPSARRAVRRAVAASTHVDEALLLALASRETNMHNIVGDGGHGRGFFQDDDRFLTEFLRATRGCRSGSSIPVFRSALPKGRVPTISAGARKAAQTIEDNVAEAKRQKVRPGHRLHVAIAGYNAGIAGAIHAYHTSGNPDAATTGGDYGLDVIQRAAVLRR